MCGMVIRTSRDRQPVGFFACTRETKQRSGPHEGGEKMVIRAHAANVEPCPRIPHITAYDAEPCDPCTLCTHDRTSSTRLPSSHTYWACHAAPRTGAEPHCIVPPPCPVSREREEINGEKERFLNNWHMSLTLSLSINRWIFLNLLKHVSFIFWTHFFSIFYIRF
jgi:hypothetical protein